MVAAPGCSQKFRGAIPDVNKWLTQARESGAGLRGELSFLRGFFALRWVVIPVEWFTRRWKAGAPPGAPPDLTIPLGQREPAAKEKPRRMTGARI